MKDDFSRIFVGARLISPFARLQLSLDIDLAALAEILLGNAHQSFVEDRDIMPVGLFALFTGIFVFPAFGCRNAEIGNLAAVLEATDFRVFAQITD